MVNVTEKFRLGAETTGGDRVQTTAGRHGKAVHRTKAAYGDEHINDGADDIAEQLRECDAGQSLAERPGADDGVDIADTAHCEDIQCVNKNGEHRADDECQRQVALGIFKLGIYRGRKYPALVRKCEADDRLEEAFAADRSVFGGINIVEHLKGRAVYEAGDGADDAHEQQGNELYDGHADLKLACDPGAECVDAVVDHHEACADADGHGIYLTCRKVNGRDAEQLQKHHRREECEHGDDRGGVNDGDEPADIVGILGSECDLGVVNDAVDLLVSRAELGKNERTNDANKANYANDCNSLQQVAAGQAEDFTALYKHARADDDTDDHRYGGRQSVSFFHMGTPLSIPQTSCLFSLSLFVISHKLFLFKQLDFQKILP